MDLSSGCSHLNLTLGSTIPPILIFLGGLAEDASVANEIALTAVSLAA